jgi:hypothetical protein
MLSVSNRIALAARGRRALALLLSLTLPGSLQGQFGPPDSTPGPPVATTTVGFGVQRLEVEKFNALLRANGFPELPATAIVAGYGTEIRFDRWDVAVSGSFVLGGGEANSTWRTSSAGSALLLSGGFAVVESERWRVTPTLGIGLTRIGYHLEQVRGGGVDSALADPLRGMDLDGQSAVWQAGIGVDHRVGRWFGQKTAIALRTGYATTLGETDWRGDDNDLSSGPRATYGGFFVRVGLSMGVQRRADALMPAAISTLPWIFR